MTVAACPKCNDEVRVPDGASSEAEVQCPLCQAEFTLGEMLDKLPPALVVLNDPNAEAATAAAAAPALGDTIAGDVAFDDGDFQLAPADTEEKPTFSLGDSPSGGSSSPTPSLRSTPSRPRKKKSPIAEVLKVGIGGVVGILIAQMGLAYCPGLAKEQRDPVGLLSWMGTVPYVNMIVPDTFRPKVQANDNDSPDLADASDTDGSSDTDTSSNDQDKGNSGFDLGSLPFNNDNSNDSSDADTTSDQGDDIFGGDPDFSGGSDTDDSSSDDIGLATTDDLGPGELTADDLPSLDIPSLDTDDLPGISDPLDSSPLDSNPIDVAVDDSNNAPQEVVGYKTDAAITDIDVTKQRAVTAAAREAWTAEANKDTTKAYYQAVCDLGQTANVAAVNDQAKAGIKADLEDLMKQISGDDKFLEVVSKIGGAWISRADGKDQGVALFVNCGDAKPLGNGLHEVSFKAGENTYTLLGSDQVYESLGPGSRILVAGQIVHGPADKIDGYAGNDALVIWSNTVAYLGE